jgi:N-acylneuraminate cytidylyltransferase
MKTVVIIPARAGSKGIPGKNLRECVDQESLLSTTIFKAKVALGKTADIYVSTEDPVIKEAGLKAGALYVPRPSHLAGDGASTDDVLLAAVSWLAADHLINEIVLVQCTAPLMFPSDIAGTLQAMREQDADCAFAAARFHHFLWSPKGKEIVGVNHDGSKPRQRRQELPIQYLEAGSVYAMRVDPFIRCKNRFCGKIAIYEIPMVRCLEVDSETDLIAARALVRDGRFVARALWEPDLEKP